MKFPVQLTTHSFTLARSQENFPSFHLPYSSSYCRFVSIYLCQAAKNGKIVDTCLIFLYFNHNECNIAYERRHENALTCIYSGRILFHLFDIICASHSSLIQFAVYRIAITVHFIFCLLLLLLSFIRFVGGCCCGVRAKCT